MHYKMLKLYVYTTELFICGILKTHNPILPLLWLKENAAFISKNTVTGILHFVLPKTRMGEQCKRFDSTCVWWWRWWWRCLSHESEGGIIKELINERKYMSTPLWKNEKKRVALELFLKSLPFSLPLSLYIHLCLSLYISLSLSLYISLSIHLSLSWRTCSFSPEQHHTDSLCACACVFKGSGGQNERSERDYLYHVVHIPDIAF